MSRRERLEIDPVVAEHYPLLCDARLNADYIGQKSIVSFPYIGYSAGMVVASVVIACTAVCAGLYIMFIMLRPKLKHGWFVKIGIACVLAMAVCLMHYCGAAGKSEVLD